MKRDRLIMLYFSIKWYFIFFLKLTSSSTLAVVGPLRQMIEAREYSVIR